MPLQVHYFTWYQLIWYYPLNSHHCSLPGGLCALRGLKYEFESLSSSSDGLTELGATEAWQTMRWRAKTTLPWPMAKASRCTMRHMAWGWLRRTVITNWKNFYLLLFLATTWLVGFWFPNQGSNLQQWKYPVLTTGPSRNFPVTPNCWSISYAWEDDQKGGTVKATKQEARDFPDGPVVKNLPCNAGDAGSISSWVYKIPHASGRLSPCAKTRKFVHHGERFRVLQQRLGATKYINKLIKKNKQTRGHWIEVALMPW